MRLDLDLSLVWFALVLRLRTPPPSTVSMTQISALPTPNRSRVCECTSSRDLLSSSQPELSLSQIFCGAKVNYDLFASADHVLGTIYRNHICDVRGELGLEGYTSNRACAPNWNHTVIGDILNHGKGIFFVCEMCACIGYCSSSCEHEFQALAQVLRMVTM